MLIYAARHGQTPMNVRDEVSGVTEIDLTETGVAQAQLLAQRLANAETPPELILASPMIRAVHTATVVADKLHLPLLTDERLREQNYGIFEGKNRFTDGFLQTKSQFAVRYPGGESMFMAGQRVYNFLDDMVENYRDKTVLVVSHGGILRVMRTYFTDMTNDEYFHYSAENADYEAYRIDDNGNRFAL